MVSIFSPSNSLPPKADSTINLQIGGIWFYVIACLSLSLSVGMSLFFYAAMVAVLLDLPIFLASLQFFLLLGILASAEAKEPVILLIMVIISVIISVVFVPIGYFARKGSEKAFMIGLTLLIFDALFLLYVGSRGRYGFIFHLVAIFFITQSFRANRTLNSSMLSRS